jgi:hypothetical protein
MRQLPLLLILTFTMLAAHGCGTGNTLPVQVPAPGDATATGGSTGAHDNGGSTGDACRVDSDCRVFDDYCTGCNCRALAKGDPDPTCSGPGVRCLVQPCLRKTAACVGGHCVAR